MKGPDWQRQLVAAARAARRRAYAPYSGFAVGAAVRTRSGRVFAAANVENASYGLAICAERAAVCAAVAAGCRDLSAVAVAAPGAVLPCGACRQVLAEFGPDLLVLAAPPGRGAIRAARLADLLPESFALPRAAVRRRARTGATGEWWNRQTRKT